MPRLAITGNRLCDGAVVWRDSAGGWVREFAGAAVYPGGGELARGLEAARLDETQGRIIGVYEVEVEKQDGDLAPARLRERIRAGGPTISVA